MKSNSKLEKLISDAYHTTDGEDQLVAYVKKEISAELARYIEYILADLTFVKQETCDEDGFPL